MPGRLNIAVALLLLAASPAAAAPGVRSTSPADLPKGHYVADKDHASVTALPLHMGYSRLPIRFTGIAAVFDYDPAHPEAAKIEVTIPAGDLDTGNRIGNGTFKGADWFAVADHPTIRFVSTRIEPGDGRKGKVTGELTLRGVTRPIVLDVTFNGTGGGMWPGEVRAGFSATAKVSRAAFGFAKIPKLVADEVMLQIEVEFRRK